MPNNPFRNATIAVALFFVILYVLSNIHSYNSTIVRIHIHQTDFRSAPGAFRKGMNDPFLSTEFNVKDVSQGKELH